MKDEKCPTCGINREQWNATETSICRDPWHTQPAPDLAERIKAIARQFCPGCVSNMYLDGETHLYADGNGYEPCLFKTNMELISTVRAELAILAPAQGNEHPKNCSCAECYADFYAPAQVTAEEKLKELAKEMGNAGYCNYAACKRYLRFAYELGASAHAAQPDAQKLRQQAKDLLKKLGKTHWYQGDDGFGGEWEYEESDISLVMAALLGKETR